jgi:hypothetical protein
LGVVVADPAVLTVVVVAVLALQTLLHQIGGMVAAGVVALSASSGPAQPAHSHQPAQAISNQEQK